MNEAPIEEGDRDAPGGDDRDRRDERAAVQAAEGARQLPVLAERVGEPPKPEIDVVAAASSTSAPVRPT